MFYLLRHSVVYLTSVVIGYEVGGEIHVVPREAAACDAPDERPLRAIRAIPDEDTCPIVRLPRWLLIVDRVGPTRRDEDADLFEIGLFPNNKDMKGCAIVYHASHNFTIICSGGRSRAPFHKGLRVIVPGIPIAASLYWADNQTATKNAAVGVGRGRWQNHLQTHKINK